ncbi:hypothetical protein [Myroides guanonis]|uniref:Uncharacterized protein n=1 Tax=Myroides guanonis TaxID=1150112 RepID=A0A1I3PC76_9FLAO|nr:hypothetical protein [Myroides guanonis]SFJ19019.1 hypothetical protein SAMN04487893_10460 [Myroides guanonis]
MKNPINKIDQLPISVGFRENLEEICNEKLMLNCWLSSTPLNPIPLLVIQLSDKADLKHYRNQQWAVDCLKKDNTHISFFNTEKLSEHENSGTLFLDIHCQKSKLYYSTTLFEFSQYRSQENHKLFVEKYKALDFHVRDYLENPSNSCFLGGGYYVYRSLEFYVDYMELLLLGFKYSNDDLHLTERLDNLEMILPYLKTFFLIDERNDKFLINQMIQDFKENNYYFEDWINESISILNKCNELVQTIVNNHYLIKSRKELIELQQPQSHSEVLELIQLSTILSTNENVMELYHFHTKTFIKQEQIQKQYFILLIVANPNITTSSELNKMLSSYTNDNVEFYFVIETLIRLQNSLYYIYNFIKDKLIHAKCFYKRDSLSPFIHWTYYNDLTVSKEELFVDEKIISIENTSLNILIEQKEIPKNILLSNTEITNLTLNITKVLVYDKTCYYNDDANDLGVFLGLAFYCDDNFTNKWHRIHETIDLYKICTTDEEVYVDIETATKILNFFQELYDEILVQ